MIKTTILKIIQDNFQKINIVKRRTVKGSTQETLMEVVEKQQQQIDFNYKKDLLFYSLFILFMTSVLIVITDIYIKLWEIWNTIWEIISIILFIIIIFYWYEAIKEIKQLNKTYEKYFWKSATKSQNKRNKKKK